MVGAALAPTARSLAALLLAMVVGCSGPSVLVLNYERGDYSQKVRPVRVGVYYFDDNRPGWPTTAAMRMFDGGHGRDAGMKHTLGDKDVNAFVAQALRAELSAMGMKIPAGADFNRTFDSASKSSTDVDRIIVGRINYFGVVGPVPDSNAAPIATGVVLGGVIGGAVAGAIVASRHRSDADEDDPRAAKTYIDVDLQVIEPQTGQTLWARSIHEKSSMGVLSGPVGKRVAEHLTDALQESLKNATWRSDFLVAMGTNTLPTARQVKTAAEHETKAKAFFDAGAFADAAKEFRKAFDAAGDANLLYNIGLCYRRAGDAERALAAYQEYLRRVPGSPQRSNVEARIDELKQEVRPNRKS